jgi:hypothetical protein
MRRGWKEMHEGADFRVPRIFYPIMGFVTPVYVLGLLGWYSIYELPQKIMNAGNSPHLWLARGMIIGVGVLLCFGIWYAWRTRPHLFDTIEEKDT